MAYQQEQIKPYQEEGEKGKQVEQMFDNIAHSYDFLNHCLSLGIDKSWRKAAIKSLAPFQPQSILDVATGTGDFALLSAQMLHPQTLLGIDISEGMLKVGREKIKKAGWDHIIQFKKEDCMNLSLESNSFDAVTVAYGIRNFEDLDKGLREMQRILRPNGRLVIIELTAPKRFPMKQLFWCYSHIFMPFWGRLISNDSKAYTYLPATMEAFPQGEVMKGILEKAGFEEVHFQRFTFGLSTLYTAKAGYSSPDKQKEGEVSHSPQNLYGLLGYPLGHSFSAQFFEEKFKKENIAAAYHNFEFEDVAEITSMITKNPLLKGFNVTIPHKENIIPMLHQLSEAAQEIGAVNVVKMIRKEEKVILEGHNTDYIGFTHSLQPLLKEHHKKALVLGTGGASKAIVYALKKLGIATTMVSRNQREGILGYEDLTESIVKEHTIIVNCTPVGTYPHVEACPAIPYHFLTPQHLLYDLVYNPETTLFLQKGIAQGCMTKNGLEMLHLQAEAAWKIWNE